MSFKPSPVNPRSFPPVFLVGMMGSGKSFTARRLADWFHLDALDTDLLIEQEMGMTVAGIFAGPGEGAFREAESRLIGTLEERRNIVVSTGGGLPCFKENMKRLNALGTTIWLDPPVDVLVQRLLPERMHRPLIKDLSDNELRAFIVKKLNDRRTYYQLARYRLTEATPEKTMFVTILNSTPHE